MAPANLGLTPHWVMLLGAVLLLLLSGASAQEPPRVGCSEYTNRSCEECLRNVSCLWCNENKACMDYPVRKILPPASLCKLSSARWGVCWVNFEALIITMSVLGGSVLLGITVCCCYCCRRKKSRKPDKSDERAMREQEERRVRQEERRAEMKSRHDEIRKKYGLFKEQNPYEKFQGGWHTLVVDRAVPEFPGNALPSRACRDLTTMATLDLGDPSSLYWHQCGLKRTILLLFPLCLYVIT